MVEYLPVPSDREMKHRTIGSHDKLKYFFDMITYYPNARFFQLTFEFSFYLPDENVELFMHSVIRQFEGYCNKIQDSSLSEKILKVARIGRHPNNLDMVKEITLCLEPNTNKDHIFKLS